MTTVELIQDFVASSVPGMVPESVEVDARLLDDRIIDSLTLLKLIVFLENSYGIQISEDEISPDNFASIGAIVELVARKVAQHGG
jgi:acyl carrier protein